MAGKRPEAYIGNQPYLFISYCHRDTDRVLPIIEGLLRCGMRVWYDEGIEVGSHWDKVISERLSGCAYVVCFITRDFLKSENCLDEIHFAKEYRKGPLIIYLEDLPLPPEMQFRYGRLHALSLSQHESLQALIDNLAASEILRSCRGASAAAHSTASVSKPAAAVSAASPAPRSAQNNDAPSANKKTEEKKVVIRPPEPEKIEPKLTARQKIAEFFSAYDTADIVMGVAILVALIFGVVLAFVHCGIMRTDILSDVANFELMKGSGLFKSLNDDVFTKIWLDILLYALFLAATFVASRNCAYEELQTAILVANIALPVVLVLIIDPLLILKTMDGSDLTSIISNGKMYLTVVGVGIIRLAIPTVAGFFVGLFSMDS